MENKTYQIAIDGPGGAGKSSVAQCVAEQLNMLFINTGGMYRCYAIALQNTNLEDLDAVQHVLSNNTVTLYKDRLLLNNVDVTEQCYQPNISMLASKIGTIKIVRLKCVADQQAIAKNQDCIMEGRDTTTVVLPNATLKIFLTATPEQRATRRWEQLNKSVPLEQIVEDLRKRDIQDSTRSIAPLTKAKDAYEVNTDGATVEQTAAKIIALFNKVKGNG